MARTRNLKPGFFSNEQLADLPALTRLLFQGLWLHADREGRLEDRPRRLKIEILPYDDCDVDAMLTQLADTGFIQRYSVDTRAFILLPTFTAHQNPHPKETKSVIPAPFNYKADTSPNAASRVEVVHKRSVRRRKEEEKEVPECKGKECKEEEGGEIVPSWMDGFYVTFREGWNGCYPGQDYNDNRKGFDFVALAAIQNNKSLTPENWSIACAHYFATPQNSHTLADLAKRYSTFLAHALDRFNKPVRGNGQMTDRENRTIDAANRVIRRLNSGELVIPRKDS